MSEARLPIHPYAAIFPAITSPDFDHLCAAIARQGLLQEIILHEGKVLDGWHRYLACRVKQVPPRLRDYAGTPPDARPACSGGSPAQAAVRGGGPPTVTRCPEAGDTVPRRGEFSPPGKKQQDKGRSAQKAAELMKVSDFSVKAADRVKKQGVP